MKLFIGFLISVFSLSFSVQAESTKVHLSSGKLFVPQGYDSNDLIEVVVQGSLPNSCYKGPTHEVIKEGNIFKIYLYAYYQPAEHCKKFSIPFQQTVNLGMLNQGKYKVQLNEVHIIAEEELLIKESVSSFQDDFLYGNIMNLIEDEDSRTVQLVGTNPTDCLVFKKMEQEIQKNMIILKPQFSEVGDCHDIPTEFTLKYDVPFLESHPRGMMLHIRVMGGRSLNYFFKNKI